MAANELFKYCPGCGKRNIPTESFCEDCDFDLLTVLPEEERLEPEKPSSKDWTGEDVPSGPEVCRLELVENPQICFDVQEGQTVGRGVEADILLTGVPHLAYISRRHAQFSRRGEQWFVQYVAEGNFLKVDGEIYDDDALAALENGSLLTLSLTSFRVVLK